MLDHISIGVLDYRASQKFYDETLDLLGYERLMTFETPEQQVCGYGSNKKPSFWIATGEGSNPSEHVGCARGFHIAFHAPTVEAIQAWYKKCLALGGKDNGAPGPRPEYHPGYYSAFIVDPNGWRIEAVLHTYEGSKK